MVMERPRLSQYRRYHICELLLLTQLHHFGVLMQTKLSGRYFAKYSRKIRGCRRLGEGAQTDNTTVCSVNRNKVSGPDSIFPAEILKMVANSCINLLFDILKSCLVARTFATGLKSAQLDQIRPCENTLQIFFHNTDRYACWIRQLENLIKQRLQSVIPSSGIFLLCNTPS